MGLRICNRCTTQYAYGLPYCPNCTSTSFREDGEITVAKITDAGGPSYTDRENADGAYSPAADTELAPGAPAPAEDLNPAEKAGQDTPPAPDPELPQPEAYHVRTVVELRELLRDRNRGRDQDNQLSLSGNKDELVERLVADDKERQG